MLVTLRMIGKLATPASPALMLVVLLSAAAASGAQQGQSQGQGDAKKAEEAKPNPVLEGVKDLPAAVDPNSYLIGAEDVLKIDVWEDNRMGGTVPVRPDGKITLMLIGDVQAAGLTPLQLTASVKEKATKFLKADDPRVTVTVLAVNSRKYYMQGEVLKPGDFPLVVPTTVMQALAKAGGFREWADTKNIRIYRDGGRKILKFNYKDVSNGKHLEQNVLLENGDIIIVKQ